MMSFRVYPLILFLLVGFYACSSNQKSAVTDPDAARATNAEHSYSLIVDSLKALFAIADTLQPMYGESDTVDRVAMLNRRIATTLEKVLSHPQIARQNLKSLLQAPGLNIIHSDDRRLWLFNWYENTGGSFKSNISLLHYRTASGKPRVAYDEVIGTTQTNRFPSSGAWFDKIYKLRSKKELYLCIGSGIACNTCIFQTAVVVELQDELANFDYPAFDMLSDKEIVDGEDSGARLTLAARVNDIEEFAFDPKTQTLTLVYLTDDLTPMPRADAEKQRRVAKKLVFNGSRFVGNTID